MQRSHKKRQREDDIEVERNQSSGSGGLLRYPGGKSRAVLVLAEFVPKGTTEMFSPFIGGASFELHCAQSLDIKVSASDLLLPLANFWDCMRSSQELVYKAALNLKKTHKTLCLPSKKKQFKEWQRRLAELQTSADDSKSKPLASTERIELAAVFFAVNRCSFSGTTLSGGYSSDAGENRFTASSLERLRHTKLSNLVDVKCMDFAEAIEQQPADRLLYLDPPYYLGEKKSNLYGVEGSLHKTFPHKQLFDLLQKRSRWILSYNNCEEIREMYKCYTMIETDWAYGMSSSNKKRHKQEPKELIILSAEIAQDYAKRKQQGA